jgi:RNA polymerase sigma factor for flagellar operon FliA
MTTREQQFLDELPLIERVVRSVCASRYLRGADAEDFRSIVMTRFIENDYAKLAQFEGRSSFKTYLVSVISNLYLDFQAQRFGKWRPSAEAKRLGTTAVRLDCLLYRDGLTFSEACGVLLTDSRVSESLQALEELRSRLPQRTRTRDRVPAGEAQGVPPASWEFERGERQALAERTFAAIDRSLLSHPTQDRLLLRLHFGAGLTLAQVARQLGLDQKALYGRRDRILKTLRLDLAREGIEAGDALELLTTLDWDAACLKEDPVLDESTPEPAVPGPSPLSTDVSRRKEEA